MQRREKLEFALVFAADLLSLAISVGLSWWLLDGVANVLLEYTRQDIGEFIGLLLLSFLLAFLGMNRAENITKRTWQQEAGACLQLNIGLAAVLAVFLLVTKARLLESRYLYVCLLASNTVVQFAVRTLLKYYMNRHFYKGSYATLVGVVTTVDRAEALVHDIKKDWVKKLQGVALLDGGKDCIGQTVDGIPVVAEFSDFMEWVRCGSLDEVYVDVPYQTGDSLYPFMEELESMGLTIHVNVPTLERYMPGQRKGSWMPCLQPQLEEFGGTPMATLALTRRRISDAVIKRMIDVVGAVVGLIISVPIILITAIPLKLESPGPLFFKQKRVGLNGRQFEIYKLRSMYQDAEQRKKDLMDRNEMQGLMFKIDDDPRITKVGRFIRKTSIDELPQFWNVLRGDMSLVGTRPPTMDEYVRYESRHKRRLSMKPGITGMWQVSGRSNIRDFEDIVKMDVYYIDHWSVGLDVKILLKTLAVVFTGRGAE